MSETPLKKCLKTIIEIFDEYANQEEPRDKLSNGELSKLLKEQLLHSSEGSMNPDPFKHLFEGLDKNKDKEVSFEEYMTLIYRIMIKVHAEFHQDH